LIGDWVGPRADMDAVAKISFVILILTVSIFVCDVDVTGG